MVSRLKTASISINIGLSIFIIWYFFFHVGVGVYYNKYFLRREEFLDDIYYQAKVEAYEELNRMLDGNRMFDMMLGDSIIEKFPVSELFSSYHILNRGIGFDTTISLLRRMKKNVMNVKVRNCFIMVGHNDLKYRGVDEIGKNVEEIITKIDADGIYFLSALPSSNNEMDTLTRQLNNRLKEICKMKCITYIDLYSLFVDETGSLRESLFYDGVHPSIEGYIVIKNSLDQFL